MTAQFDIAANLEALAKARVLVAGDVILDRFAYGTVERISPEGPIPILQVGRETAMLGGAGNVLRNVAALGARGDLLAIVGDDAAGREVQALADAEVGGPRRLIVQAGRPTTIKERFVAAGQQLLRTDREAAGPIAASSARALIEAAKTALGDAAKAPGALVLSDYGKGALDRATVATLIEAAGAAGRPVVVDPKERDFTLYAGATLITPNRRELREATGMPTDEDEQVVAACRAAIKAAAARAVLATRSERGMTLVTAPAGDTGPGVWHFPALGREIYDVSGAGDTVAAVVATALAAGLDLERAARLANLAAGIVVGKLGTAVARPSEIVRAQNALDLMLAEAKVTDTESLIDRVDRWRRAGLRLGFTNGCFDLLHPGHVSLLAQARAACDRLIVGLNSDASVRRLKGEQRPVQPEAARATVLASLSSVDLVVVYGEDTPLKLIEALRPEVLVKGADYTMDQVVGADLVRNYGGRVVLAEIAPGFSTSGTIEKLSR